MSTEVSVKIAGKADVMQYVDRVEFIDAIDRLQALVLDVGLPRNTSPATIEKLLPLGKPYNVSLMRDGSPVGAAAVGDVMELHHRLHREGGHQVVVTGLDSLHKLRGQQVATVQLQKSHVDVIKAIASAHKLSAKVTGVGTAKFDIFEPDVLDSIYVQRIAREYNCAAHVDGKNLVLEPVQGAGAAVKLEWPKELYEVDLRANLDGLVTKVTVAGYSREQEKAFKVMSTPAHAKKISGPDTGVALSKKSFGETELVFNQSGYFEQNTATARAKAELQRRAERYVQGSAVVVGTPELRAGKKVTFANMPWPFAGTFLLSETRHVVDRAFGYRTFISFISDSLPKA